jgi:hypothetical protein
MNVDIQRVEELVIPYCCRNNNDDDDDDHDRCGRDRCRLCDRDNDRDNNDYSYTEWVTLDILTGVYNPLDLSYGADTLLTSGLTIAGKIKKICLTIGDANVVVIDSDSYLLNL